jgi:hypothetical protein
MPFKPAQWKACFAEAKRKGKSDAGCRKMVDDTPGTKAYSRHHKRAKGRGK